MGNLTVKESGEMINFISPNVSNITSFKVHFSPRQEGSGDPSPENVREITGWNGVEGYNFHDVNLFNYMSDEIKSGYRDNNGNETASSSSLYTVTSYPVQPNQQLFIGSSKDNGFAFRLYYLTQDEQWIEGDRSWRFSTRSYATITIPSNCYKVQLQFTNSELPDLPTLQIRTVSTTSIDWTEDVGTVYGGYVDLISGELVQTIKRVEFTWGDCEDATVLGNTERRYIMFNDNRFKTINNLETKVSNIFSTFLGNSSWDADEVSCAFGNNTIICKLPVGSDNNTIIQVAGDLATPITHQLTPQQLSTLKGQNNFWSNADYVEIEYELTETFDIQKAKRKIILSQPHVKTASGDIVTFDTNMKGKLKECKVYFSPVQEGEGDPSPDNVRNITGWNGVSVYKPSENLIPSDIPAQFYRVNPRASDGHFAGSGTAYSTFIIPVPKGKICLARTTRDYLSYGALCDEPPTVGSNAFNVITMTNRYSQVFDNSDGHKYFAITTKRSVEVDSDWSGFLSTEPRLTIGDVAQPYTTPTNISTHSIDWTDEEGTVYGGYVDLVSGELVATHLAFVMDGVNHKVSTGAGVNTVNNMARGHAFMGRTGGLENLPLGKNNNGLYAINKYVIHGMENGAGNTAVEGVYCGTGTPYVRVVVSVDDLADVSGANAIINSINEWLTNNPVQICYTLAEPIHYQLTPQQILTLKSTNNIYSNTNGQIEIKYWKH